MERPEDPVVIPFRPPPKPDPRRLAITWLLTVLVGIAAGRRFMPNVEEWVGALMGGLFAAAAGALMLFRKKDQDQAPTMTFSGNRVNIPAKATSLKTEWVDVRDILHVEEVSGTRRGQLLLRTKKHLYVYPVVLLGGREVASRIRYEILDRIRTEPDGRELLAAMRERDRTADRLFSSEPRGTRAILFVLAAIFFLTLAVQPPQGSSTFDEIVAFMRLGASVPHFVLNEGEYFRLLTANLLHSGMIHIGFNALAILALGYIVERLLGTPRFLVLYLVSGVTGTIASCLFGGALLSVGASTSVFGLFLAWAYFSLRFNSRLPAGFAMTRFQWIILIFNFGLAAIPFIDGWGHGGGAVGGVLVAAILVPTQASFDRATSKQPIWSVVAAVLIAAYVGAIGLAIHADTTNRRTRADIFEAETRLVFLNNLAFEMATDRSATPADLEAAYAAAQKASADREACPPSTCLDTLATTAYRVGKLDEAVGLQVEVVSLAKPADPGWPVYWSQLHRFLRAYEKERGSAYGVEDTRTATITLGKREVTVEPSAPGTYFVGLEAGPRMSALLEIRVNTATVTTIPVERHIPLGVDVRIRGAVPESGEPRARLHPHDRTVDKYP